MSRTDPMQLLDDGFTALQDYEQTGRIASMNDAVRLMRVASASAAPGSDTRLLCLTSLGIALRKRFQAIGVRADLSEAIAAFEAVLEVAAGPDRLAPMNEIAACRISQYERDQSRESLDVAIAAFREVVAATPLDHPRYSRHLSNLGYVLDRLFETGSEPLALDESIQLQEQAVAAAQRFDQEYVQYITNLAASYRIRFSSALPKQSHQDQALTTVPVPPQAEADESRAIDLFRTAASTAEDEAKGPPLVGLGTALFNRFRRAGSQNDLAEAIDSLIKGIQVTGRGAPYYHTTVQDTASALLGIAVERGSYIDQMVELFSELVENGSESDPEFPDNLVGLGISASMRYEDTGALTDLEVALAALRRAVAIIPTDYPKRPWYMGTLGSTAWHMHMVTHSEEFRALAIESLSAAVAVDNHNRMNYLNVLGLALRGSDEHEMSAVDQAGSIALFREVLASASVPLERGVAAAANNLGIALLDNFRKAANPTDLEEGIAAYRQALTILDNARSRFVQRNLAEALWDRFTLMGDSGDRAEALLLLRSLAEADDALPSVRVNAAARLGRFLMQSPEIDAAGAMQAFEIAVALWPRVAWRGMSQRDREHVLASADWYGLGSDAAACAIAAGEPERAVELFEHGRTLLWSQLLETRTDLSSLADRSPELAARLRDLQNRMTAERENVEDLAALSRAWDETVMQARELPGLTSFLKPPGFTELQVAAADGPVVMLVVSTFGCHGLAVTRSGVQVIPLPLTWSHGFELGYAFHRAAEAFVNGTGGPLEFYQYQEAIRGSLNMLWEEVTGPVLDALGYQGQPDSGQAWPRLWWCPTGIMALTPLHAALPSSSGRGTRNQGGALDRVVSSYTISLRALINSRMRPTSEAARRLLLVGVSQGPSSRPLTTIHGEISDIENHFPNRCTVLLDHEATADRVLADLPRHAWAHFACHGGTDLLDPSSNGLLVYDRWLAIRDITALRLDEAHLAYLSACQTARGGSIMADEAIHITAAMQMAGYRHVIGTLWEIEDRAAHQVAQEFYKRLSGRRQPESMEAAEALHEAIRRLRQLAPEWLSSWAAYVHYGP